MDGLTADPVFLLKKLDVRVVLDVVRLALDVGVMLDVVGAELDVRLELRLKLVKVLVGDIGMWTPNIRKTGMKHQKSEIYGLCLTGLQ